MLAVMDTPTPKKTRTERAAAAKAERQRRQRLAEELAAPHEGVVTRAMLLGAGLTRGQVRSQIERGAWRAVGHHTISVTGAEPTGRARWWWALWESGRHAALDGVTALLAGVLCRRTSVTVLPQDIGDSSGRVGGDTSGGFGRVRG